MTAVDEYMRFDAVGLADAIRRRQLSAAEALEAAIARADAVNPRLNAITIPMYEIGRARADRPLEGPLAGVPFLLKDLFQDYAGVIATSGCMLLKRAAIPAKAHSELVNRWLAAGTVIFGRTNTPEFGAKGITEPAAWGPTRNPYELGRSPGGSSGGAAAAVASGIVPVAGASDGGGSIRIPSASCGLFGLKPGRGRTPNGPDTGEAIHGSAVNHVVARSVRDSACFLDAAHGPELGSPYRIEPPPRPYLEEVGRDPGRLKIAFSTRSPIGTDVDPEIVAAVERCARRLEALGHHVEGGEPAIDGLMLARDFLAIWYANCAHFVEEARAQLRAAGSKHADDRDGFELDTLAMAAVASAHSGREYVDHYMRWHQYGFALAQLFQRYDLYLTPTMAQRPPRIGEIATPPWAAVAMRALFTVRLGRALALSPETEKIAIANLRNVPFTQLANLTGVPAMSVPFTKFADGLPLGVQFVAPHGGEGLLLRVASQLEEPSWHDIVEPRAR